MPVRGPWIGGHEGWFYVVGNGDPERREKPRMVTLNVLPVGEYIETRLASQTQSVGRLAGVLTVWWSAFFLCPNLSMLNLMENIVQSVVVTGS